VKKTAFRHGDVILVKMPAKSLPTDAEATGSDVIMEGEVTGHAHRVSGAGTVLATKEGRKFLKATKPITLTHEEHGPLVVPTGTWEITRQREYEPDGWRPVMD